MPKKPRAIVLGGTSPHIELIKKLKRRGYFTILVDYYDNPPAKEHADLHIQESTLDKEKVLGLARKHHAELVISTSVDQANVTACFVSEKLDLPHPYSYNTSLYVTDKLKMKKRMLDHGIPTSKFILAESFADFEKSDMQFPLVVKPSDSTGSKGVRMVRNLIELKESFSEALEISRNKQVIIEEYATGQEVQFDFIVQNGRAELIMTRDKHPFKGASDTNPVLQSTGSTVPTVISEKYITKLESIGQSITDAFLLSNTVMFLQAKVGNGCISVLEFACRIGGGLSYSMLYNITGNDIISLAVDLWVGKNAKFKVSKIDKFWGTTLLYAKEGIFLRIKGLNYLRETNKIVKGYTFKTKGTVIGSGVTSNERVGGFLLNAPTRKMLFERQNECLDKIQIIDLKGNNIVRKGIYNNSIYDLKKSKNN